MESTKSLEIMKHQKQLKELLNNEILDIIIFGSSIKKGIPKDIDIALIVKDKTFDTTQIKRKINNIFQGKEDIQIIGVESIYSSIWLTLLKEGYSIKKDEYLFNIYKIKPKILYKYNLKKLNNTQKVQFERGLKKTMGKDGMILTRSVILVPIEIKNSIEDLLKTWKIYYESTEYELLPILRKEQP